MKLLTKQEVASRLGIHPESLMRLSREGRFPQPIKLNLSCRGRVRFDEVDVITWLGERKSEMRGGTNA
jgi:predicted DNA-binding transcriptional regulator AlpA